MDPELIAYLDRFERHFAELRQELREESASIRQELRQETSSLRQETSSLRQETSSLRQELRQETSSLRQETSSLRQELRQETSSLREELASFRQSTESRFDKVEAQIQELQAETRESRVMIEDLYSKVQLVAEGVVNNSEVIERLRAEVKKDLADVRSEMRAHDRQTYHSLDVRVTTLEKARKEH